VRYRAVLVSPAEEVTVPAGTFKAVHVRTTVDEKRGGQVSDVWFAPGVGLVKSARSTAEGRPLQVDELLAFTKAPPRDHATVEESLARHAAALAEPPTGTEVLQQPHLFNHFRNRFAVLTWRVPEVRHSIVRVRRGVVTPFDVRQNRDWLALLEDEDLALEPIGGFGDGDQAPGILAKAAAELLAATEGRAVQATTKGTGLESTINLNTKTITATTSARGPQGVDWERTVSMKFEQGKLADVAVIDPYAPKAGGGDDK
jgi:hypothetical protein